MKSVYIPRDPREKAMQRAMMQYFIPKNRPLVREALRKADRDDLIGYGKGCLVPPEGADASSNRTSNKPSNGRGGEKRGDNRKTDGRTKAAASRTKSGASRTDDRRKGKRR